MKTKVKSKLWMAIISLLILNSSCINERNDKPLTPVKDHTRVSFTDLTVDQRIAAGSELVQKFGCNDCHSPKVMTDHGPVPDPERLLSGHQSAEVLPAYDRNTAKNFVLFNMNSTAAIGPWGISYAANLTPDPTGIGSWSEEQFKKAMREGKFKGMDGGRMLLPPMPWPGYSNLSDDELTNIFLYLKSVKPVNNIVPNAVIAGK